MLKKKAEHRVWKKAGLTTFFLKRGWTKSKNLTLRVFAGRFLLQWDNIFETAANCRPGDGFEVPLRGRIKRIEGSPAARRPQGRSG